jgi:hypothetical protein
MRSTTLVSFFQRVVLATLVLPSGAVACGGSTGPGESTDSGATDATQLPGTPCNWSAGSRSSCEWSLSFTGDPATCAGYTGSGTAAQCLAICGRSDTGAAPISCNEFSSGDGGQNQIDCFACTLNGGRRPQYFASLGFGPPLPGREVGSHFARVACMEAGSIEAFRWLRDELVAHGAPRRLVRAASRAIRDEQRHVRVTSALARRFGEEPIAPRPAPARVVRPLVDVALENAVEGCVRETYSALECLWQAQVADDPVVRAEMRRIARDELRHLALSWEVHAWIMGRLGARARDRVRRAQDEAIAVLLSEVASDPHESLLATAGLPRGDQSRALVAANASRLAA